MMRVARMGVIVFGLAMILIIGFALTPNIPSPPTAESAKSVTFLAFDHSNCQYPTRWSNPVDGCDNSDPAVPECIKAIDTQESENACIAEFVAQKDMENTPVAPTSVPSSVENPSVAQCSEGK